MEASLIISILSLGVAASVAIYNIYKNYWEKPNINLYVGQNFDLVTSYDDGNKEVPGFVNKIHLYIIFLNSSNKTGIIKKMKLILKHEENELIYYWDQFFEDINGGVQRRAESLYPYPIAIQSKDSKLNKIQFICDKELLEIGIYEMEVHAWMENNINKSADIIKKGIKFRVEQKSLKNLIEKTVYGKKSGFEPIKLLSIDE